GHERGLRAGHRRRRHRGARRPGNLRRPPLSGPARAVSGLELDRRPVKTVVIGSQLAYGAVGNNTVARMIEAARHRCVQVPTVVLSNLPHYPSLAGGPVPETWLTGFLDDLLARQVLDDTQYVFVGYLGEARQAEIIAAWYLRARERYPQLKLILDPAM